MSDKFTPHQDSVAVSFSNPLELNAAISKIANLTAVQDSVRVSLRGGVSALVTLLNRLEGRVNHVSMMFSVRGDKPVAK